MKKILLLALLFVYKVTGAQTQQQWAQLVGWDGVSSFTKYIHYSSRFMGPNALTVPHMPNGSIDSINSIGLAGQMHFHFKGGDNTQNLNVYGNFCVAKGKMALEVNWLPVEHFNMSDSIKRQRHVYYRNYYDNVAKGDVIVNSNINLLNKWREKVQLMMQIGVRLPSSSNKGVAAARFLDATAYYINVSCGKPLSPTLKLMAMVGLYVWQINMDDLDLRQNDAFLFGSGVEWNKNRWKLQANISGYLGYLESSGDKPVLIRLNAERRISNKILLFRFQYGYKDYRYISFEAGAKVCL